MSSIIRSMARSLARETMRKKGFGKEARKDYGGFSKLWRKYAYYSWEVKR